MGTRIDYALVRIPNWAGSSAGDELLPGSLVVEEGRRSISLGYVFPDPNAPLPLPDTAMAAERPRPVSLYQHRSPTDSGRHRVTDTGTQRTVAGVRLPTPISNGQEASCP